MSSGAVIVDATGGIGDADYVAPKRKPRTRRNETALDRRAINYLRGLPNSYARKVHGGAMGNVGEPDIDACVGGRSCKFETKAGNNTPTVPQRAALQRWAGAGALVGWYRDLDQLRALLEHTDDLSFVPDLGYPGCRCPLHVRPSP